MNPNFYWEDEFESFLNELPEQSEAKLLALIEKIEEHGLFIAAKQQWVEKIEKNLYEIQTVQNGIFLREIYFQVIGDNYFITHGFKKKTNRTPKKEITKAKQKRAEILQKGFDKNVTSKRKNRPESE